MRNKIAKGFIIVGALLLAVTAFLHLYLGIPPIAAAIESGHIQRAPSMRPSELLGVWVAFSVIFFFIIAAVLAHMRKPSIDKFLPLATGLAAIGAALTMLVYNPGVHIAVPLLSVPGVLIIAGAVIFKAE